jgi:hypothetical protein
MELLGKATQKVKLRGKPASELGEERVSNEREQVSQLLSPGLLLSTLDKTANGAAPSS